MATTCRRLRCGARIELNCPTKEKLLLVPRNDVGMPVWVERGQSAALEVLATSL